MPQKKKTGTYTLADLVAPPQDDRTAPETYTAADVAEAVQGEPGAAPATYAAALNTPPPTFGQRARQAVGVAQGVATGAMKGAFNSATGLGQFFYDYVPPVRFASDVAQRVAFGDVQPGGALFDQARQAFQPTSTPERIGTMAEQIAEYFVPGAAAEKVAAGLTARLLPMVSSRLGRSAATLAPRMGANAGAAAGVTAVQGGDVRSAAGVAAAVPVAGRVVSAAAQRVGGAALPLIRAAVKPTVTGMKQQAGASVSGINAVADRLSRFILEKKLTTPAKAEALITEAEREIQALLKSKNAVTDAPQRVMRYLGAIKASAARQALPAHDVRLIVSKARELLRTSPLAETVMKPVQRVKLDRAGNAVLDPKTGQAVMETVMVPTRVLRKDVMADEALELARGTSRWNNRKAWGELKGATAEASKAAERGMRDSVKSAVPETRPVFAREKSGIQAKQVLDRMAFRQANRDAVSLPAHVIAAGEIARGKVPFLSMAANWLRNNQMKAGIYAKQLEDAIGRGDVKAVGTILARVGVGAAGQQR